MAATVLDRLLPAADFCICISAVGLFGSAYSGHSREKLWETGGVEGWNSNPNQRVYYYANYKEPPEIPLIWSQRLTDATLAIALLSVVVMTARIIMTSCGQMSRTLSLLYDAFLSFLWLYSISAQASSDFSDPKHPSPHPWYLTRYCHGRSTAACRTAQASFVISVIAAAFYSGRFVAMVVEAAKAYRTRRRKGYQLVSVTLDLVDEEGVVSREDAFARERERYLYREALSPVLAFFPDDSA